MRMPVILLIVGDLLVVVYPCNEHEITMHTTYKVKVGDYKESYKAEDYM